MKHFPQNQPQILFINLVFQPKRLEKQTSYWLRLLQETQFIDSNAFDSIHNERVELLKILNSIILTSKQKQGEKNKKIE
jgi:hypothetical protein